MIQNYGSQINDYRESSNYSIRYLLQTIGKKTLDTLSHKHLEAPFSSLPNQM